MALSLTDIRIYCQRCIQSCKSFMEIYEIDIVSCATDILIGHPFTVLRRQCQVQGDSHEYHLTPVSLLPVVAVLIHRKGFKVLFKGLFSVVLLRTVEFGVEKIISKLTGWPSELPPTPYINKYWFFHFLLKSSSYIVTSSLYSASVIDTVAVTGDFKRNQPLPFQKYDFPLSFWQTMLSTTIYRFAKYIFTQTTLSFSKKLLYFKQHFDTKKQLNCQGIESKLEDKQDISQKASVISYLIAEVVLYPIETIVHRLILQGTQTFTNDLDCGFAVVQILSAHNGFLDCLDNVTWLEGKLGLYKGFGALITQAIFYHYCIKFTSFAWHYLKIFIKTYYRSST